MKYALQYHGENAEGVKYFTIITDDGRKLNQCGIDVCFIHFTLNKDNSISRINYLQVPTFSTVPSEEELIRFKETITKILGGLIPIFLPVFTGSHADFFNNGGKEKMVTMLYPCDSTEGRN